MKQTAQPNGKLVLASTSPRRKDLLTALGLTFQVLPSTIDEIMDPALAPEELVLNLAQQKTADVFKSLSAKSRDERLLVLGADTIVVLDGNFLGKPTDRAEAIDMLKRLSGRAHEVYTGVWLIVREEDGRVIESHSCERSKVFFRSLDERELEAYVDTGEPMDKAGAYALQGIGAALIEKIEGSHTNIVGLPIPNVVSLLRDSGYLILGLP
ncbi:MAG: septum formation inhibitor Maf [Candidatus Melainabacteria bacterium]|nr:MAG: septum formation inhibitor Maf [Candidatus Melainabacteria bacterium]